MQYVVLSVTVLQQERPPRSCSDDSGMDTSDDVFCVKEGEGLKIKLKRKVQTVIVLDYILQVVVELDRW